MTADEAHYFRGLESRNAPGWMVRAMRVVLGTEWFALAMGVIGGLGLQEVPAGSLIAAAAIALAFVVASTLLAVGFATNTLYFGILVVAGAVLTMTAVTLTGGADSPFLLLALTPSLLAAVVGGFRLGVIISVVSAGLVTAVTLVASGLTGLIAQAGPISLFLLMAVVVAQIRSLLVDADERAASLEEASLQSEAHIARLEQANQLLRKLTDMYGEGGSNPLEVALAALQTIVDSVPGTFATATLFDTNGPVVVARVGSESPDLVRTQIPLGERETTSGMVLLGTPRPLTADERLDIDRLLRPVAVSFANTVLLHDIASTAVREERLRLARELHDEVGPALAALGLSLDATQMYTTDVAVNHGISYVREGIGSVIDDLRGIIADLRAESSGSLVSGLRAAVSELEPPPTVTMEIQERRPPRAIALRQILAIVTESVRNAYRHANAQTVTVQGVVDRDRVDITVTDDGKGFDPAVLPEGHFGVLGMQERASRMGGGLDFDSGPHGTTIRLVWREKG